MNPLSGRFIEKVSRVAFHIRAVSCEDRSEMNALIKNFPVDVAENCLPVMT